MGIVKLRQLVCKDCGDLDPNEDDIVETAAFQHNTYIESINEIFNNNGMNQKENSDKSQGTLKKSKDSLTDNIFTEVNVSKKSKKKQLSKDVVCELLVVENLRDFKSNLITFIRDLRKLCRVPTIKGPDDGERRAQEMLRDGKADWTNEQRNNAGLPQDPSMVLSGGKSSSSKGASSVAVSGSSSKSRAVEYLPAAAAAASSSDGGVSYSPDGYYASERQSKKSPVPTKVRLCLFPYISLLSLNMNVLTVRMITAPDTKRSIHPL